MSAGQELTQLEPALAAVREAWEPYAQPIRDLGHELDTVLRPEAWRAHRDVRRAGLGHRHAAQRRASDATHAVDQAEADIAAIRRDAAPIEHHLDQLEHHASTFRTRAGRDHELDLRDQRELR